MESFHHLLKYIYMRGRSNRRIDKLLHTLKRVARDKAIERLCKLEKGLKISGFDQKESSQISTDSIKQCNKYRLTPGSEAVSDIPEAVYSTTRGRSPRGVE